MWFWWFILICDACIPMVLLMGGILMWKRWPRRINRLCGYRSARSMQNMDTWKFANTYCGRNCWKIGAILLMLTILTHIPFYQSHEDTIETVSLIVVTIQVVIVFVPIFLTEKALRKTFDRDGNRL